MRRWRDRGLHHQLFAWLALTILATIAISGFVLSLFGPFESGKSPLGTHVNQVTAFAADRFAERWADAPARDALAREVAEAFGAQLTLVDDSGRQLFSSSDARCRGATFHLDVERQGERLGRVDACMQGLRRFRPAIALSVMASVCVVLWTAAAILARRMTRPLSLLIATTREIGSGNLSARVRLGRHQRGELRSLAESVNDMAQRIERQMKDQRELLAAVSHEVRSPLARLRLGAEILRADPRNERALDSIEQEVVELDGLVGNLLASSRLDFGTCNKQEVVVAELFRQVLSRHQLPEALLEDRSEGARAAVDATLISRALDNLIDNALRHAGGVSACCLRPGDAGARALVFEVRDAGRGFESDVLPRVFEAFYRGPGDAPVASSSLGLGLSLVRRIALAHGGDAWARNVEGGAIVAFSVAASLPTSASARPR
jgi:two-component system, OmpR family, sensor kinase